MRVRKAEGKPAIVAVPPAGLGGPSGPGLRHLENPSVRLHRAKRPPGLTRAGASAHCPSTSVSSGPLNGGLGPRVGVGAGCPRCPGTLPAAGFPGVLPVSQGAPRSHSLPTRCPPLEWGPSSVDTVWFYGGMQELEISLWASVLDCVS